MNLVKMVKKNNVYLKDNELYELLTIINLSKNNDFKYYVDKTKIFNNDIINVLISKGIIKARFIYTDKYDELNDGTFVRIINPIFDESFNSEKYKLYVRKIKLQMLLEGRNECIKYRNNRFRK